MSIARSAAIAQWLELGRSQWPEMVLAPSELADHLERLGIDLLAEHRHAADVYLACGCARGDAAALEVFEAEMMPAARAAAARLDRSRDFIDEVMQAVRERVLVATPGQPPRIAEYSGRGPLRAWVRIAASRLAMNMLRQRRRNALVDDEAFFDVALADSEEERRRLRERYADACADSLRAALGSLTARQRNLLRMHHIHGLTVDQLAPAFGVHRATVARWLAAAREALFERTRSELQGRLDVGTTDAGSILRRMRGRFEVSVTRLLVE